MGICILNIRQIVKGSCSRYLTPLQSPRHVSEHHFFGIKDDSCVSTVLLLLSFHDFISQQRLMQVLLLKPEFRHCLPRRIVTVTVGASGALVESGGLPTQVPQTVVAVVGCELRLGTRPHLRFFQFANCLLSRKQL